MRIPLAVVGLRLCWLRQQQQNDHSLQQSCSRAHSLSHFHAIMFAADSGSNGRRLSSERSWKQRGHCGRSRTRSMSRGWLWTRRQPLSGKQSRTGDSSCFKSLQVYSCPTRR